MNNNTDASQHNVIQQILTQSGYIEVKYCNHFLLKTTNGWNVIGMFYADISLCEFKDSLSWKGARNLDSR